MYKFKSPHLTQRQWGPYKKHNNFKYAHQKLNFKFEKWKVLSHLAPTSGDGSVLSDTKS